MMPAGHSLEAVTEKDELVSILVLLDDACRLILSQQEGANRPMFQSLFFWMMPAGHNLANGGSSPDAGFNPCSSG
mgnify:CR=1 FL=1